MDLTIIHPNAEHVELVLPVETLSLNGVALGPETLKLPVLVLLVDVESVCDDSSDGDVGIGFLLPGEGILFPLKIRRQYISEIGVNATGHFHVRESHEHHVLFLYVEEVPHAQRVRAL